MKKILVIHGPHLSLPVHEINAILKKLAEEHRVHLEVFQSNHEGEIVSRIGEASGGKGVDALVINPAAYTHTSLAIRDALATMKIPAVEVHLSNIYAREEFRHHSLVAPVVKGQISGFGVESYALGFLAVLKLTQKVLSPIKNFGDDRG